MCRCAWMSDSSPAEAYLLAHLTVERALDACDHFLPPGDFGSDRTEASVPGASICSCSLQITCGTTLRSGSRPVQSIGSLTADLHGVPDGLKLGLYGCVSSVHRMEALIALKKRACLGEFLTPSSPRPLSRIRGRFHPKPSYGQDHLARRLIKHSACWP